MKTANIDKDEIRREMGLYSVPEVAGVTNISELTIGRAVTVTKELSFQAGQDGQLLIGKSDLSALLAGKTLSEGPKLYPDSEWFGQEGMRHFKLAKAIEADPQAYFASDSKFGTVGIGCLVAEARSYAYSQVRSNTTHELSTSSDALKVFYFMGPDKFATLLSGLRSHLSHLHLKFGAESMTLASFSCSATSQRMKNLTKRHGSFSAQSLRESGIAQIKSTRQFTTDIETALKKAF